MVFHSLIHKDFLFLTFSYSFFKAICINCFDSTKNSIFALLQENEELTFAWSRFNNEMAMMYSEDLIQFFQQQNIDEMALKSKIPMAFYFLTLVLMLSTFFFIFRAKQ